MKKMIGSLMILASVGIPSLAHAQYEDYTSHSFTVSGVVPDRRYIVVDTTDTIQQVFSNTDKAVQPVVVLGNLSGEQLPFTQAEQAAYTTLMSQLGTNKVVSIKRVATTPAPLVPQFITQAQPSIYDVTPTKDGTDILAIPYQINL